MCLGWIASRYLVLGLAFKRETEESASLRESCAPSDRPLESVTARNPVAGQNFRQALGDTELVAFVDDWAASVAGRT